MNLIRINNESPKEYQFSGYKAGWILEIINDFGKYYTAKLLTGNVSHKTDSVMAIKKIDCKFIRPAIKDEN